MYKSYSKSRVEKISCSHLTCFGGYARVRHEINAVPDVTECVDICICGDVETGWPTFIAKHCVQGSQKNMRRRVDVAGPETARANDHMLNPGIALDVLQLR